MGNQHRLTLTSRQASQEILSLAFFGLATTVRQLERCPHPSRVIGLTDEGARVHGSTARVTRYVHESSNRSTVDRARDLERGPAEKCPPVGPKCLEPQPPPAPPRLDPRPASELTIPFLTHHDIAGGGRGEDEGRKDATGGGAEAHARYRQYEYRAVSLRGQPRRRITLLPPPSARVR